MSLQDLHERLLSWATAEPRTGDLLAARNEYYARYGEPREDELSYESRVNGMLDHYLYDYRPNGGKTSTLENFVATNGAEMDAATLDAYRTLTGNVHGLFEVRKIEEGRVVLRDVFSDVDHEVAERRQLAGLHKGDLIEVVDLGAEFLHQLAGTLDRNNKWKVTVAGAELTLHDGQRARTTQIERTRPFRARR